MRVISLQEKALWTLMLVQDTVEQYLRLLEAFEIWNLVLELVFPLYFEPVAIHAPFCINYLFISRLLSNDVNFEILVE